MSNVICPTLKLVGIALLVVVLHIEQRLVKRSLPVEVNIETGVESMVEARHLRVLLRAARKKKRPVRNASFERIVRVCFIS